MLINGVCAPYHATDYGHRMIEPLATLMYVVYEAMDREYWLEYLYGTHQCMVDYWRHNVN
jgi:hypothetical protein